MISTALLGMFMGLSPISVIDALLWIVFYVIGISAWEIVFKLNPLTKTPSPYVYYLENMKAVRRVHRYPFLSYLGRALLVMVPVGAVAFIAARIIS